MMYEKNLHEMMSNISKPNIGADKHQSYFRQYLLKARRSAWIGSILLILPFLFILGNVIEHELNLEPGIFGFVPRMFFSIDEKMWMLGPLILIGGPLVAFILNFLSILYIRYEKTTKELHLSFKVSWSNIAVIAVCGIIVGILFLYLLMENLGH